MRWALEASQGTSLTTSPDLQLMQPLTEAPAVTLNPRDGVVAEVQLVQGCEAIEGATVHFHQAVGLQVPADTHRMRRVPFSHYRDSKKEASLVRCGSQCREGSRTERRHILFHSQY